MHDRWRERDDALLLAQSRVFAPPPEATEPLYRRSKADGLACEFNAAWLTVVGRSLEASLRRGWLADVHADDRERCALVHAAMLPSQRPYRLEFRLRHVALGHRWVMEQSNPLFAADGSFLGFVHHAVDVHETTEWADRLAGRFAQQRRAIRQHARFEAALAHEFEGRVPADLQTALLTMAQLAGGAAALRRERLPVSRWLEAAARTARGAMPHHAASLTVIAPTESLEIEVDGDLLGGALATVLVRLAGAASNGTTIELRAVRSGSRLTVDLPAGDAGSAFVVLEAAVQRHGGEIESLAAGRSRLSLPLAAHRSPPSAGDALKLSATR
jgi:PAS fold